MWVEKILGDFGDKRRWREYKNRVKALPPGYRTAAEAVERYLMYAGALTRGDVMVAMYEDLADLFEQGAADGTPVRAIVGEDPVEFAEVFLRNYSDAQWISRERQRLSQAIDQAEQESGGAGGGESS